MTRRYDPALLDDCDRACPFSNAPDVVSDGDGSHQHGLPPYSSISLIV